MKALFVDGMPRYATLPAPRWHGADIDATLAYQGNRTSPSPVGPPRLNPGPSHWATETLQGPFGRWLPRAVEMQQPRLASGIALEPDRSGFLVCRGRSAGTVGDTADEPSVPDTSLELTAKRLRVCFESPGNRRRSQLMQNDKAISVLNDLIETCKDGEQGFKTAAEGLRNADVKNRFMEYSRQRGQMSSELQAEVRRLGRHQVRRHRQGRSRDGG